MPPGCSSNKKLFPQRSLWILKDWRKTYSFKGLKILELSTFPASLSNGSFKDLYYLDAIILHAVDSNWFKNVAAVVLKLSVAGLNCEQLVPLWWHSR